MSLPYVPQTPHEVARRLILRRWLSTLVDLFALTLFVAAVLSWAAYGAGR
ncbi:hypothetical protein SAMN04515666_11947 [Bosea lupini]|uniref:Uncharacterized protein n=1 Tax=Bosea lupini TaxID=1036779 RepID=A0A1H8AGL1_9HYPH|nr:hypothetical protein [Bosea lupini]SEM69683.1 hypothetical protein SAMN04515666_11947 [Bosea lupini]